MISILVCSINEAYFAQVRESINKTIGVEYELISWNNLHEGKGICEVYNMLAGKARFNILLFVHEDIIFEEMGWGQKLVDIYASHPEAGMIGVAGSKYKSASYSGWYTGIKEFDCARIRHRYPHGEETLLLKPNSESVFDEVVCLDGVFISCRKNVWAEHKFDEQYLKGFHFYDIDFSLRAGINNKILVSYEIPMLHITVGGNFGNNWMETAIAFHDRQKSLLPRSVSTADPRTADRRIIKTWFDVLKHFPVSAKNKWVWIRRQRLASKPVFWYSIIKFMLYQPLGLGKIHKMWKRK